MIILYITLLLTMTCPQYLFKSTSSYKMPSTGIELSQETPNNINNGTNKPGPKKVSGIGGWIDWLTWGLFNSVPSSATNELMYAYYDYILLGGNLSYADWINSQSVPLGSPLCLILIAGTYILAKKLKKSETSDLL